MSLEGPAESVIPSPSTRSSRETLLFCSLMVFLASQGLFLLRAPDLGLHIVAGEYTFHNGLPAFNVFSPVNSDHPLVQHEWAFQVLTYGVVALVGMDGLSLIRLAVVLLLGVVAHRALRPGRGYQGALICLGLGLFVAHMRFIWRPELFSLLFLAIELKLLIDFVEDRRDRLIWLPVVFAIWANFHGYFLVGLIVGGCFVVGEFGESIMRARSQERSARLLQIGSLCVVATAFNPYFAEGAIYPFKLLIKLFTVDSQFTTTISELRSPHLFKGLWSVKAWYPLLIVFVFTCLAMRRRIRFAYLLTALAIWVMARSTFRNIGLFGLTFGLLAAVQWQTGAYWGSLPARFEERFRRTEGFRALGLVALLLAGSVWIATNRLYFDERVRRTFGAGVASDLAPPARDFIAKNIPVDAQVFNSFDLGSRYLWWFYPERRPFIDGNGDGYPPEFYREYVEIYLGRSPLLPYMTRHGLDWLYLDLKSNLARVVYRDPRWHPVYLDGDGVIFVNRSAKFAALRKATHLRRSLARGEIPNWQPTALPSLLNRAVPFKEGVLGKYLLAIGEARAASVVSAHARLFFEDGD